MIVKTLIEDLPPSSPPGRQHVIPAMADGKSGSLSVGQILSLLEAADIPPGAISLEKLALAVLASENHAYDPTGSGLPATDVQAAVDALAEAFDTAMEAISDIPTNYYSPTNSVGPVSQAAGVPTGSIIESGSNANGRFTKFADGTMICRVSGRTLAFTSVNRLTSTWVFPATFINTSISFSMSVAAFALANAAGGNYGFQLEDTQTGQARFAAVSLGNYASGDSATGCTFTAIGRWF